MPLIVLQPEPPRARPKIHSGDEETEESIHVLLEEQSEVAQGHVKKEW